MITSFVKMTVPLLNLQCSALVPSRSPLYTDLLFNPRCTIPPSPLTSPLRYNALLLPRTPR